MKRNLPGIWGITATAACLSLLTVSCMKENDGTCPADVASRFSYTFNADFTDLFDSEVDNLYLYLFDSKERYVTSMRVEAAQLEPSNIYTMELDGGAYKLIAWGNLESSSYRVQESSPSRGAMELYILTDESGEVNGNLADLFYGSVEFHAGKQTRTPVDVQMVKNTKNIRVLIPETGQAVQPDIEVRITGSNGALDFENNTVERPTRYKPGYSKTTHQGTVCDLARFKILKLRIGDDTSITLDRDGTTVREDNLVEVLVANFSQIRTDEDLMRYSDYEFIYELDDQGVPFLSAIKAGEWTKFLGQQGGI